MATWSPQPVGLSEAMPDARSRVGGCLNRCYGYERHRPRRPARLVRSEGLELSAVFYRTWGRALALLSAPTPDPPSWPSTRLGAALVSLGRLTEAGATLRHAHMADPRNGRVLDDHPVVGRSAFDAVAEGEQTQGEQNWAEDTSGYGGPSSRHGEWLACAAEDDRLKGDLHSGSGTLPGPPSTGWWKPGLGRAKCGVDPAGMLWGACDGTCQVLGRCVDGEPPPDQCRSDDNADDGQRGHGAECPQSVAGNQPVQPYDCAFSCWRGLRVAAHLHFAVIEVSSARLVLGVLLCLTQLPVQCSQAFGADLGRLDLRS